MGSLTPEKELKKQKLLHPPTGVTPRLKVTSTVFRAARKASKGGEKESSTGDRRADLQEKNELDWNRPSKRNWQHRPVRAREKGLREKPQILNK